MPVFKKIRPNQRRPTHGRLFFAHLLLKRRNIAKSGHK